MLIDLTATKDSQDRKEKREFTALPEGEYSAVIEKSELKDTKDGTGQYVSVMWKVTDGPHKKRVLWHNYHIKNKSAKAVSISKEQLSKLISVNPGASPQIQSPMDLLGLKAVLTVGVKFNRDMVEENTITGYSETTDTHQGKSSSIPGL